MNEGQPLRGGRHVHRVLNHWETQYRKVSTQTSDHTTNQDNQRQPVMETNRFRQFLNRVGE
jgi:hypothetical protein